jgi:hypothetical protein
MTGCSIVARNVLTTSLAEQEISIWQVFHLSTGAIILK